MHAWKSLFGWIIQAKNQKSTGETQKILEKIIFWDLNFKKSNKPLRSCPNILKVIGLFIGE